MSSFLREIGLKKGSQAETFPISYRGTMYWKFYPTWLWQHFCLYRDDRCLWVFTQLVNLNADTQDVSKLLQVFISLKFTDFWPIVNFV